jgi:hypothetical protein
LPDIGWSPLFKMADCRPEIEKNFCTEIDINTIPTTTFLVLDHTWVYCSLVDSARHQPTTGVQHGTLETGIINNF